LLRDAIIQRSNAGADVAVDATLASGRLGEVVSGSVSVAVTST
jgi:hypothetical protein